MLNVPSFALSLQLWLKRALDLLCSGLAMVALSPLLVLVALLVRMTSSGPALFSQERVGKDGRKFKMLKFRSMVVGAEELLPQLAPLNERKDGPVFKMARDPRITRLGRVLRRYSIDELPQLFNVFAGDMSLVGPRPPLPDEVARYSPWQLRRLSVTPGLTCLWQLHPSRRELRFDEWVHLDLRYIDGWHLGRDLSLIVRTLPAVITGNGQC